MREPWFTYIKNGRKTVEGRLNKGRFKEIEIGTILRFIDNNNLDNYVTVRVVNIINYDTFRDMLETEGIDNVLPDESVRSIDDGVLVYREFYSHEAEKANKVLAIKIKLME